jgi:hypothetical protein
MSAHRCLAELKRPRAAKIGGESSDQILTIRNLGRAETLCRRSEKAALILPQQLADSLSICEGC